MNKKFVIYVLSLTVLSACTSKVDLVIDNPTSNKVQCYIDSTLVEIESKDVVHIEIDQGDHSIRLDNDSVVAFNFTQAEYFINPSLSEYLMYEQLYGTSSEPSAIPSATVTMFGFEFEGNFKVFRDAINPVEWDYGPRETPPDTIAFGTSERPGVLKLMDQGEVKAQMLSGLGE